jgi:hypothetical protein
VGEVQNGTVTRTYAYGLERIDENQTLNDTWLASFYGYDGHGSVRQLTNLSGTVTDYDYRCLREPRQLHGLNTQQLPLCRRPMSQCAAVMIAFTFRAASERAACRSSTIPA